MNAPLGHALGPKPSSLAKLQKLVQLQAFKNNELFWTYTFLINPQAYQQTEASRTQIVQTLGGGYVDLFGPALIQIQFSGTTGLQQRYVNGNLTDGYERFMQLLTSIRDSWRLPIANQSDDWHFYFYNWTDDQFFEVMPLSNTWQMAVPQQTVFFYQISMVALREMSTPAVISTNPIAAAFIVNPSATAVVAATQGCVHAAMTYLLTQTTTNTTGISQFIQSVVLAHESTNQQAELATVSSMGMVQPMLQQLQQRPLTAASYVPYLQPSELPLEAFYPGVSAINNAVGGILTGGLMNQLETVAQGGAIPLAVSYGEMQANSQSLTQQLNNLEALPSTPMLLDAELGDLSDRVQQLLLFPQLFQA